LDFFGWERCLFGCDWPVFDLLENCEITNIYEIVNTIVERKYFNKKNIEEILNAIFYQNAVKVYKLKIN
jgi:predicted TIM-barrel fold metal-dependent hydrolase